MKGTSAMGKDILNVGRVPVELVQGFFATGDQWWRAWVHQLGDAVGVAWLL